MPIYEFKCLECEEYMEILVMGSDDDVDMACKKCGGSDLERILSSTQYKMTSGGSGGGEKASAKTRTCSGGSCTTWDIPGPSR